MSDAEDKTASLLAALWVQNRPVVEERVVTIETAAVAAAAGPLNEETREKAQGCAHKLAGSLGMYGFDEGTRIARQMEQLLETGTPDPARLIGLVADLRGAIFPNG